MTDNTDNMTVAVYPARPPGSGRFAGTRDRRRGAGGASNEFELYDRVRLVTDRFADAGAPEGSIGYVIEKYDYRALEVEVSDSLTGETVALFVAEASDLERAAPGGEAQLVPPG